MDYINASEAREIAIKSKLTHKQIELKMSMDYIMEEIKKRAQKGDIDISLNDWVDDTIPFYDKDTLHLIAYELQFLGYKVSFNTTEVHDVVYFNISWEGKQ